MRKQIYFIIVAVLCLTTNCTEETLDINGKGTITGTVVQDATFQPLSNVKISTNPNTSTVFTDADGKFTLEVDSGTYAVKAEQDGFLVDFESADVETDEEITVVFELQISTANNRPPPAPSLIFPADDATDVAFDITFDWDAMDPDGDSLIYSLELRNANTNEVQNFSDIEVSEFDVTLQFGTSYFWQIIADDGINEPVNSAINSFTTTSFPANRFHYVRKTGDNNVIYSADVDGNEVALTSASKNSWRPRVNRTVSKIAFLRTVGSNVHLFVMDRDGNNVQQVSSSVPVSGFNLDEVDISWTNNGSSIYYPSLDKLYRINTDGSGLALVYQTNDGNLITEVNYNNGIIALKTNNLDGYNVNIFTINESGQVLDNVLSGVNGAAGGLELSIDNARLLYSRDVSGFQSAAYRQLDSRVFIYTFSTNSAREFSLNKPGGTNDLDPRFSPTDAQIIVTNRPNDTNLSGTIQTIETGLAEPREDLFENSFMPDWE
jgi:predicted DNA binding protein